MKTARKNRRKFWEQNSMASLPIRPKLSGPVPELSVRIPIRVKGFDEDRCRAREIGDFISHPRSRQLHGGVRTDGKATAPQGANHYPRGAAHQRSGWSSLTWCASSEFASF